MNAIATPPADAVERPLQALLDLVENARRSQCEQILGEARARAAAVREKARLDAHARLREAFAEQRHRRDERIAAAQARLATQQRLHRQQHTAALLALAQQQLPAELQALWARPATRAAWVADTLAVARRRLPAGEWTLQHAPGWPDYERVRMQDDWPRTGITLVCREDPKIAAGLKVMAGGNVIDGTLAGLVAGRADFEARLLRALEPRS